jgi:hypothetical protein
MRFFTDLARERALDDRFATPIELERARPVIETSQNRGEENRKVDAAILAREKAQHLFRKGDSEITRIPCIASPLPAMCPTTFAVSTLLNKDVGHYKYTGKPSVDMTFPTDKRLKEFFPPIQMKVCEDGNAIIAVNNTGPSRIYFAQPGDQCKKIETTDQTWRVMSLLRGRSPSGTLQVASHKEYEPMGYIDREASSVISPTSTPSKLFPPPFVTTTTEEFFNMPIAQDVDKKYTPQMQMGSTMLDGPVELSTATSLTYPIAVRRTTAGNFEKAMFTNPADGTPVYTAHQNPTRSLGSYSKDVTGYNTALPVANSSPMEKSRYQSVERLLAPGSLDKSGPSFAKDSCDTQLARLNTSSADIYSDLEINRKFINLPQWPQKNEFM